MTKPRARNKQEITKVKKARKRSAFPKPFQLPNGHWRNIITVDGERISKTLPTLAEIMAWSAVTIGKRTGRPSTAVTGTVFDLWRLWEAGDNTSAESTRDLNKYCRRWLNSLMPIELKKLTAADIDRAYDAMRAKGNEDETVKAAHRALSCVLNWGERKGHYVGNVMPQVTVPTVRKKAITVFTLAQWNEFMAFVDAQPPTYMGTFLRLSLHTYARIGELHALRWSDLRGNQCAFTKTTTPRGVQLGTKTKKDRVITLAPSIVTMLNEWRDGRHDGYIFSSSKNSARPYSSGNTRDAFHSLQEASGIHLGCPNTIRHSGITRSLSDGHPVTLVARRAGNSPATIYKYYSAWIPGEDDRIALSMERATT